MKKIKINESQLRKIYETSSFVQHGGESNLCIHGADEMATSVNAAIIHNENGDEINQGETDSEVKAPITGKKVSSMMSSNLRSGYIGNSGRGY